MTGLRIAVVDDDLAFLDMIRAVLNQEKWEVLCSTDMKKAYVEICEQRPHLVILDMRLGRDTRPGHLGSGWTLLELLRFNPTTKDIPVLICSADVRLLRQKADLLIGKGCDILEKPFGLGELYDKIGRALASPSEAPVSPYDRAAMGAEQSEGSLSRHP